MDLSRAVYSRDLKVSAMRALDGGCTNSEVARKFQLSPKLLERWREDWRAKGETAVFPGVGRRGSTVPGVDDAHRIAELERKIGQLTMENDFLALRENLNDPAYQAAFLKTTNSVFAVAILWAFSRR